MLIQINITVFNYYLSPSFKSSSNISVVFFGAIMEQKIVFEFLSKFKLKTHKSWRKVLYKVIMLRLIFVLNVSPLLVFRARTNFDRMEPQPQPHISCLSYFYGEAREIDVQQLCSTIAPLLILKRNVMSVCYFSIFVCSQNL